MLTLDFDNAFNLYSRSAFLDPTKVLFPELLPWLAYCYPHQPAYLCVGAHTIRSVPGTQHGDNLAGLLFHPVLHPIVLKFQHFLASGDDEGGNMGNLLLHP